MASSSILKAKATRTAAAAPAKPGAGGRYDWGDKKGAVHSISADQHRQNSQSLTAPPTYKGAMQDATAAADVQYGPQVQAAQQMQVNLPTWYADHMARVAGYAKAALAQSQPVLDQAQAFQTGTGQALPPGVDPNSTAGQTAATAAKGREALAGLGKNALQANSQATQDYLTGQGALASRELPQALAAAAQSTANVQSQRGAAITAALATARQNAQNYGIARATLGANVANNQADNALTVRGQDITQANNDANNALTERGQDISATNAADRQAAADAKKKAAALAKKRTEAKKHTGELTKATGGVQSLVTDIIGKYDSYVGQETDDTSKPLDPKTKKYPGRPLTKDEIKRVLGAADKAYTPGMLHVALMVREGKPLDQAAIDYLHQTDPNVRIPREWLRGKPKAPKPPDFGTTGRAIGGFPK